VEEKARTLIDVLERRAERSPDRRAFTLLQDGEEPAQSLRYGELCTRARAIAAELSRALEPGDRAALLYPSGLEFIEAYFGCLYAGVVAVPLLAPTPSQLEKAGRRLVEVFRSADPRAVLSTTTLRRLEGAAALLPRGELLRWIYTDAVESRLAPLWRRPRALDRDSLAFLQYTSGSTGSPRGVMVTHGNLLTNNEMIRRAFDLSERDVFCHWLPMYHDMGLIGHTLAPVQAGAEVYFMSPTDFLQKPVRWLRALTRFGGTMAASPNFGYELCVRRVSEAEKAGLELSRWTKALNGAEPVVAATLRRFSAAFAGSGFRESAFRPCYGLAEATLLVSGTTADPAPVTLTFDQDAFSRHEAIAANTPDAKAVSLVASGTVAAPGEVAIVDPETGRPCEPGQVGEIWLRGEHVARGYWRSDVETEATFRARRSDGAGPFLRTGDLGVRLGDHLVVTGRLKDLIIQRGTNYYPQDLERVAEEIPGVRPAGAAVFGLRLGDAMEERVVAVVEVERRSRHVEPAVERRERADPLAPPASDPAPAAPPDLTAMMTHVREELLVQHGVAVYDVCVVPAGAIPRTSSGKLRRRATRELYLSGELPALASLKAAGTAR
jgi:acyl-CoA synthetase (AMP-forming)/AMP-acid ligase II